VRVKCTAQTFHSNFTLRLKKKLVGFSHYGHFSASLALQQRIANDPNEALTVIKVPNDTRPIFSQADPKLDVESQNTKKVFKKFHRKNIWVKKNLKR
jgi:hypothetical protein